MEASEVIEMLEAADGLMRKLVTDSTEFSQLEKEASDISDLLDGLIRRVEAGAVTI